MDKPVLCYSLYSLHQLQIKSCLKPKSLNEHMIVDIVQSDDSSSNSNSNDIGEKTPGFYGTEGGSYFFANSLAI